MPQKLFYVQFELISNSFTKMATLNVHIDKICAQVGGGFKCRLAILNNHEKE